MDVEPPVPALLAPPSVLPVPALVLLVPALVLPDPATEELPPLPLGVAGSLELEQAALDKKQAVVNVSHETCAIRNISKVSS